MARAICEMADECEEREITCSHMIPHRAGLHCFGGCRAASGETVHCRAVNADEQIRELNFEE